MNFKKVKNNIKKSIAGILAGALVCSGAGINKLSVSAANTKTYISDVKLITGDLTQAVKDKYEGYKFIEKSLSEGGGGTSMYMAYKTTTNPNDAIRDISFMQMKGNYSVSAYEKVLEDNMELAKQMAEELKCVASEYRNNYCSGWGYNDSKKRLAIQTRGVLNKYYNDDIGVGMGDFFLKDMSRFRVSDIFLDHSFDLTDEDYITLAMQAPRATLTTLISIIAKACDEEGQSIWLDRLAGYNGFDGLALANGFDPNDNVQRKAATDKFETEYGDTIKYLTEEVEYVDQEESICAWDKFANGLKEYAGSLKESLDDFDPEKGVDADTTDEFVEEIDEKTDNQNGIIFGIIYEVLSNIKYGDGTLADLFMKSSAEITKEELYPIIASLSAGQRIVVLHTGFATLFSTAGEQTATSAANESSNIFEADENSVKEETGKTVEEIQETVANNQISNTEEVIETIQNELPDEIADAMIVNDKISVFAGVDRSFFNSGSGIAMTTSAQDKDSEQGLNDKKTLPTISYILGSLGIASTISGAAVLALANSASVATFDSYLPAFNYIAESKLYAVERVFAGGEESLDFANKLIRLNEESVALDARASQAAAKTAATYRIVGSALMVVGLALTAYAIYEAVMSLIKQDDPKYTEIPIKMVDSSNGEKKNMDDFLYYNAVLNDSGAAQDLNNWTSGMWLAMYTSKTKDAGGPILADSIKIQKDSNNTVGMSSAHLFGETGAYNMLTYSKNSKSQPKLFMYFEKDEPSKNTGSVFGMNTVLASVALLVIGCAAILFRIIYKKRKDQCAE